MQTLTKAPFKNGVDAEERLACLRQVLLSNHDRRTVFLSLYVAVTEEVNRGIREHRFKDNVWLDRYLTSFANLYRDAFYNYEIKNFRLVPEAWKIAFDTSKAGNALIQQELMLGVNAHVNYDLAIALDQVSLSPDRAKKYADHNTVNDILKALVEVQEEMLAEMYAPGFAKIDASLGKLDETFFFFSLKVRRENAWKNAVALSDAKMEIQKSIVRLWLGAQSAGTAHLILSPNLNPELLKSLKQLERATF